MIKHIVCFKLKEGESPNKAKEVLLSMKGNVPTLIDIEVGVDVLHSQRSYDMYLAVTLESLEKLNEYQQDEYHCNVVKKHMHAVALSSVAIDFEI